MEKLNLLLAVHCHQPQGNFKHIFRQAYQEAYLPFIEVLERHPSIKIGLHYSGALLNWLKINSPEFLKKIKRMVRNNQIEILAGAYYEPILSLIPEDDAIGQIRMLKEEIADIFSYEAKGAWLAERVWEPQMAKCLNLAGIDWTIVDDSHFRSCGLNNPELPSGYYLTEEEGHILKIFAASERLRYLVPFRLPGESIGYLKNLYEEHKIRCVSFADDGEKFGLWPGTFKWVYKESWLDNFFQTIEENSDWIETLSFEDFLNKNLPAQRVYLNCASYREMMEWSGGFFRNFLARYSEANWLHKRMLYVSQKLSKLKAQSAKRKAQKHKNLQLMTYDLRLNDAQRHLYMAQTNDVYWHGVFGGLYLNYLRGTAYSNLIEAEKLIRGKRTPSFEELDLDCDRKLEVILNGKSLSCFVNVEEGGALRELDYKPKSLNLINTLMRRPESYHARIKARETQPVTQEDAIQSIHEIERERPPGLENFLFYDSYPRYCALDHFFNEGVGLADFLNSQYHELGDFIQGRYKYSIRKGKERLTLTMVRQGKAGSCDLELKKAITLTKKEEDSLFFDYSIRNRASTSTPLCMGIEFNLSVYDNALSSKKGILKNIKNLSLLDQWTGLILEFYFSDSFDAWHFPIETVSDSETGRLKRTYQQLCLLFVMKLKPEKDFTIKRTIRMKIKADEN